jgi:predicted amidophosphoribosyltransferase
MNCNICNSRIPQHVKHSTCTKCRWHSYKDKQCPDCGKLINRKSSFCLSCRNKRKATKGHNRITGSVDTRYTACIVTINKAKGHTKDRNINVTAEYLYKLLEIQQQKCAYTGIPMELPTHKGCKDKRMCASLDRIDSSKGYVEGNVQWVIAPINYMKHTLSDAEFRELLSWIK